MSSIVNVTVYSAYVNFMNTSRLPCQLEPHSHRRSDSLELGYDQAKRSNLFILPIPPKHQKFSSSYSYWLLSA